MAARSGIGRIARLTLFSGPNCSLCDIAKAELAKVRQQRPFELETVNIQDPGQERWKRMYVYWIPALHVEGKEVAKGRWDAQTVNQALDTWEQGEEPVYVPLYVRHREEVLGDEEPCEEELRDVRRCFNCGSPDHVLTACPEPFDRALVSLSRQLFNFYRGEAGGPFQRIHEVEEWRQQRLRWLDEFEPGQIKGSVLREALGLEDGDPGERVEWLRNMAFWGYPPGWVGPRDPRERVWELLAGAASEDTDEECEFTIIGDEEEERVLLTHTASPPRARQADRGSSSTPRRWAKYPDTYFLWSKLPVYKGSSFPPMRSEETSPPSNTVSATFDADRQALWQNLLISSIHPDRQGPSGSESVSSIPPWRILGNLAADMLAPEPARSPPPLPPLSPPPLPPSPPPALPSLSAGAVSSTQSQQLPSTASTMIDDEDMDLSD
ncbi:DUF836-domain-containing protein [Trametes coccinea BRFM310]|uniref:DUF836-domain-containing protein n=1 Tax=Trametes coccinea (strain BRFM310) TaxID=1353009 RepID=A0A1Y2J600_TRAC3|nr:DUF836-domain-containing protein [Trametes coccinea BRFM310]